MNAKLIYKDIYTWVITNGPSFIFGVIVLFIGLWLIKLLSKVLNSSMHKRSIDPSLKPFLSSLAITGLRVLLILGVMQIVGIQMTVFAAITGGLAVAAGLALSGTLQNFASGVIILFLKPFEVGDNIIAQGQEGTVTSIQIFYTIVTTFDNRTVIVPNSKLSNEVIINISSLGSRRLDIEMKFNNNIDYNEVKKLAIETIHECENILHDPEPRIGISSIEADGYKVMINVWVKAHGFTDTKLSFQENLMNKLKNSGMKLPGM